MDSIYQYYSGKFLPYHYFVHVLLIAAGAIAVGVRGGSAQTTKKAIGLDCRASIGPRNGASSLGYFRHGTELDGNITAIETVPAIGTVKSWTERNAAAPREREGTTVRARVMQQLVSIHRARAERESRLLNPPPEPNNCYGARTSGRSPWGGDRWFKRPRA